MIYGISDVDVVERTLYDLSFKYFLGLDPLEAEFIHPATLTKFRMKRLKDSEILNQLLSESMRSPKVRLDRKSNDYNGFDTYRTRYNFKSPQEVLIEQSKQLRKSVYGFKMKYKKKLTTKPRTRLLEDHIEYFKKVFNVIGKNTKLLMIPATSEKV